jgi:hypothetical protein
MEMTMAAILTERRERERVAAIGAWDLKSWLSSSSTS